MAHVFFSVDSRQMRSALSRQILTRIGTRQGQTPCLEDTQVSRALKLPYNEFSITNLKNKVKAGFIVLKVEVMQAGLFTLSLHVVKQYIERFH